MALHIFYVVERTGVHDAACAAARRKDEATGSLRGKQRQGKQAANVIRP